MVRIRAYVDTSVFGGVRDAEFARASEEVMERARRGDILLVVSRMVLRELDRAPEDVRKALEALPPECLEFVEVDADVEGLAAAYLRAGILAEASRDDAIHVAAATVARADVILSWNFRHIVNYDRIRKYNAVNILNGFRTIDIRSPMEMTDANDH